MTETAIVCEACGAKLRATHTRCPRCRAILTKSPVVQAPSSDLPGKIVAGILALAVVATMAILWTSREQPESTSAPVTSGDPLGNRRPVELGTVTQAQTPTGEVPADPAFAVSYRLSSSTDAADEPALERLRATIARDPQDAEALAGAGRALLALGRSREALQPLKQAMELQPENWTYAFGYAHAAARAEEWTEAVAAFRRARSLMPEDAATSYDLALARQKLLDYAGAVEEYKGAIGLDSSALGPRLGLAISLDRLGKATEAAGAYADYLRLAPAGPEADRVHARLRRLGG